jgi:vacuolar-type H+-ATPase subunit H
MSTELETRLKAVETTLDEIKKLKGIPGPRGAAGPIEAAVKNADDRVRAGIEELRGIVANALDEFSKRLRESEERVRTDVQNVQKETRDVIAKFREQLSANQEFVRETVANQVDGQVLRTLHDYHLLKDGTPSADYFRHEFEPAKKS